MSPKDTTLTLIVTKELKAQIQSVADLDGRGSMNNWFWTYLGPIMENLVEQQLEHYKHTPPRPVWKIDLPKKGRGKGKND